jgi:sterol desaturase/sphingolipid hydroxylase (fatty acid hydroxylase superfamily)
MARPSQITCSAVKTKSRDMTTLSSIVTFGAVTGFITLVLFTIGFVIEKIAPAAPVNDIRLNVIYGIFVGFVRPAVSTMLAGVSVFSIGMIGGGFDNATERGMDGWKVGISAVVYLLALDFAEYLFHRAQHAVPFLWALHSFHHSDRTVNVTTTTRHHWIDIFIKAIAVYLILCLLFAVPYQALLVTSLVGYYNYFLHCNVRVSFGR